MPRLFFVFILIIQSSVIISQGIQPLCLIKENILYFSSGLENGERKYDSVLAVNAGYSNPVIAADSVGIQFRNRIYIAWSDKKNGQKNDDVFLIYSDDHGKNWTEPILVTYYPNHKAQHSPKIKVDANGNVLLLYIDCKNYYRPDRGDIVLSVSENGGLKFSDLVLNEAPLNTNDIKSFDFLNNDSVVVYLRGGRKIFAHRATASPEKVKELQIEKTFTWNESLFINFKNTEALKITASLTKPLDPSFETYLLKEKLFKKGANKFLVSFSVKTLKKDAYILNLYYNNKTEYVWILPEQ